VSKTLTGDSDLVTVSICGQADISQPRVLLGPAIEAMSEPRLAENWRLKIVA